LSSRPCADYLCIAASGLHMAMRYFEDFQIGQELPLGRYAVTRGEIVAFAAEFDPQPFHLDEAAGADSLLGGLAASGWHTCALFMRILYDGWLREAASMGSPGVDMLKWVRPVRPGDVLSGRSIVLDTRASNSRADRGFVRLRHEIVNGRGEIVMLAENPIMFSRRPS
jgi:acyl dehydratase